MKTFSESAKCISIDLPGHGKSELHGVERAAEEPWLSLEIVGDILHKVIHHVAPAKVTLVGYSMGARIALYMALKFLEIFTEDFSDENGRLREAGQSSVNEGNGHSLSYRASENLQHDFDTTQNRFLVAGEDGQVKFWDVDNINPLTSTDADGGLQGLPRLKFNKEGNILAVTTMDSGFKMLANATGLRSLRTIETPTFEALRPPIESAAIKPPQPEIQAGVSSYHNNTI
ncbi:hypothetical protein KIW84_070777 [Lathyrus oleraceus]|uniref:AB hydrolase-1 domain-containing protein n=1 Tax=Pisum sativum TaxID=3888 RepID=A0A9D4VHN8_PEA|nr:hypothetical protein KIW84_070777 [Pisum sativum]